MKNIKDGGHCMAIVTRQAGKEYSLLPTSNHSTIDTHPFKALWLFDPIHARRFSKLKPLWLTWIIHSLC